MDCAASHASLSCCVPFPFCPAAAADGWQLWQMDQTSDASVNAFIQRVKNTYGKIDLLVLNAGPHQHRCYCHCELLASVLLT